MLSRPKLLKANDSAPAFSLVKLELIIARQTQNRRRRGLMTVYEVRKIAIQWVNEQVSGIPGLHSVFFDGSINSMDHDNYFPDSSDVDLCFVVRDSALATTSQRKLRHHGLLLDASFHPLSSLGTAESVLKNFIYAYHLSTSSIIYDPSHEMEQIHRKVAEEYPRQKWVQARRESVLNAASEHLIPRLTSDAPLYDRIWAFLLIDNHGLQLPLISLLKPPSFKKSIIFFRDICKEKGLNDLYQAHLQLIGSAPMGRLQFARYLGLCTAAYDFAVKVKRTPFFMDFNVSAESRSLVIDGSLDLLDNDCEREAIAWILFGWSIAIKAIENDAPATERQEFITEYYAFLRAIGLETLEDFSHKADLAKSFLAMVDDFAGALMSTNERIVRTD